MLTIKDRIKVLSPKILEKLQVILNNIEYELPYIGEGKDLLFTGGAAVTMLLEELKWNKFKEKKEVLFNDFDFFYVNQGSARNDSPNLTTKKEGYIDTLDNYGRFLDISEDEKYTISKTEHIGPLNITCVDFVKEIEYGNELMGNEFFDIISRFDINATQFGISMSTGEIYVTDAFLDFLESGQLRTVDFETPHHTAVRLVKKADEHGYFFNEKELLKLAYFIEYKKKFFGQKYYQSFAKHSDVLAKYFKMECIFFPEQKFELFEMKNNEQVRWKLENIGIGNIEEILGRGSVSLTAKSLDLIIYSSAKKISLLKNRVQSLFPDFKEIKNNYAKNKALSHISILIDKYHINIEI